jgi:hypothetical protein
LKVYSPRSWSPPGPTLTEAHHALVGGELAYVGNARRDHHFAARGVEWHVFQALEGRAGLG